LRHVAAWRPAGPRSSLRRRPPASPRGQPFGFVVGVNRPDRVGSST
jgi:hypothetical protein